jgi:putative nucleotidyltransferase-like protein
MPENPEFEFLRACCHSDPSALDKAVARQNLQWDRVFRLATDHRLLLALYARLQGRADVPASIHSALKARFLNHCQRVLRFTAEFARIWRQFELADVPVIAHKGPVLAHMLYSDAAMRQFGDLDFLVRPSHLSRACAALVELGYAAKLTLTPRQEREYLRSGYEHVFGCGREQNLVELQWQVLPRFYAVNLDVEQLFQRSRIQDFESCAVRTLCDEDLLLVLCIHAAKHQWMHLGMIRDIATLMGRDLEWEEIMRQARQLGIERMVLVSLLLARNLLGCRLPEVASNNPSIVAANRIALAIADDLRNGRETNPESVAYFRAIARLRERRRDRARFLMRLALTPSVGEWKTVRLPDKLFPMYRGVRAFRLLKRFAA